VQFRSYCWQHLRLNYRRRMQTPPSRVRVAHRAQVRRIRRIRRAAVRQVAANTRSAVAARWGRPHPANRLHPSITEVCQWFPGSIGIFARLNTFRLARRLRSASPLSGVLTRRKHLSARPYSPGAGRVQGSGAPFDPINVRVLHLLQLRHRLLKVRLGPTRSRRPQTQQSGRGFAAFKSAVLP
jgi:hypothetical protein